MESDDIIWLVNELKVWVISIAATGTAVGMAMRSSTYSFMMLTLFALSAMVAVFFMMLNKWGGGPYGALGTMITFLYVFLPAALVMVVPAVFFRGLLAIVGLGRNYE
jgi:hypothetical protein